MTPEKTQKYPDVFWTKMLEKYSQLLSKIFSQISVVFGQKRPILHDFSKLKKKNPNMEKLGQSHP